MLIILLVGSYNHYIFFCICVVGYQFYQVDHGKGCVSSLGLFDSPRSVCFLFLTTVGLIPIKVFLVTNYGGCIG